MLQEMYLNSNQTTTHTFRVVKDRGNAIFHLDRYIIKGTFIN